MSSEKLPTFTRAEVESHNNEDSCFVTIGRKVYDITDFVDDHPGGAHYILDYAGKDVSAILKDDDPHFHSETAYEILDESLVGVLAPEANGTANGTVNGAANGAANGTANGTIEGHEHEIPLAQVTGKGTDDDPLYGRTGMSTEADLSRETDYAQDLKKHKFLDLNRPLLAQIWNSGFSKRFYLDQVHKPRHYRGGKSAPFFGNFLEPLSLTVWWLIPTVWLPCVAYGTYLASQGLSPAVLIPVWSFGWGLWSLIEYALHRFLFHLDYYLPDNRVGITLHFLLHGVHHYLPMDKYRLVMPPALFLVLATPFWKLAHFLFFFNWYVATAVFSGGLFGYVCYDMTHYWIHFANPPFWYKELKRYHLAHHFLEYELAFGITNKFWDNVFGTGLPDFDKKK